MGLFDGAMKDGTKPAEQTGFEFPKPLVDKYQPRKVEEFLCERPRNIMSAFLRNPHPDNFYFLGESGTGKTTMALALAEQLPAELHHIPSQDCNLATVKNIADQCHFMPRMFSNWQPCKFHLVLVDEADKMSPAAYFAFFSLLDATKKPPNTIFIFTGNSIDGLEPRFMSRCKKIEFSNYGLKESITALLERIWAIEAGDAPKPNFARIVKESKNNVRDALNSLEVELMSAEPASRKAESHALGMLAPVTC